MIALENINCINCKARSQSIFEGLNNEELKLLESIKIIKENLYDANGNMINDNTIDVEDKDKCIRIQFTYT